MNALPVTGAPSRRGFLAAAAGASAVALVGSGCGPAARGAAPAPGADGQLRLPAPGGRAPLGTVALHLVDRSRSDPFAPKEQPRELMVQLWYPAAETAGRPLAGYMDAGVAREWEEDWELPSGVLGGLHPHAQESAALAHGAEGRGHPVVLYSPGDGSARSLGTTLIEELVSRGYLVAAVDHPYDASVVEFPGGELVAAKPHEVPEGADLRELKAWDAFYEPRLAVRVADVRFVLDALKQLQECKNPDAEHRPLPAGLAGALDLSRVGMLGHSLGGCTAAQVAPQDARLRAVCALDSPMPRLVREARFERPVLLMRSAQQPGVAAVVDAAWKQFHPTGWHRDLRLTGSGHNTFTDFSVLCADLGSKCPKDMRDLLGSIDGHRAVRAQRAYVTAFFDQHLNGDHQALLDGPSSRYPQVEFLP